MRETGLLSPTRIVRPSKYAETPAPRERLQFFNGFGGFSEDGREYVTVLDEGLRTPEPWINVIANPMFGFIASESGAGFTWAVNSHENQLTPWSNDHVDRHARRSDLHPRRKYRRGLEPYGAADSRRYGHVCRAAWPGIHAFPARIAWDHA